MCFWGRYALLTQLSCLNTIWRRTITFGILTRGRGVFLFMLVICRTFLQDLSVLAVRRTMQINSWPTEITICFWKQSGDLCGRWVWLVQIKLRTRVAVKVRVGFRVRWVTVLRMMLAISIGLATPPFKGAGHKDQIQKLHGKNQFRISATLIPFFELDVHGCYRNSFAVSHPQSLCYTKASQHNRGVLASEGWWEAWQPSPKVTRSY